MGRSSSLIFFLSASNAFFILSLLDSSSSLGFSGTGFFLMLISSFLTSAGFSMGTMGGGSLSGMVGLGRLTVSVHTTEETGGGFFQIETLNLLNPSSARISD